MSDTPTPSRWTLRQLPFAARLTLAVFLISVGIGYFSALVQLHFQHAKPGELMPTPADAVATFHGLDGVPVSTIERLIIADENLRFAGTGQMASAFTSNSSEWKKKIRERGKKIAGRMEKASPEEIAAEAEKELREERRVEREAMVKWLRGGADENAYRNDNFLLPAELASLPLTEEFKIADQGGPAIKLKSMIDERCARCHAKDSGDKAASYPLDTYEHLSKYLGASPGPAMSVTKLAQTTHVHLLGFSMLYLLTGIILALTGVPAFIRVPLAPLPLVVQVIDISCWWLARLDGETGVMFAKLIPLTGAIVGGSLGLQLLLSLFALFGAWGRVLLVALILAAGGGGFVVKEKVIDPHMKSETKATPAKH